MEPKKIRIIEIFLALFGLHPIVEIKKELKISKLRLLYSSCFCICLLLLCFCSIFGEPMDLTNLLELILFIIIIVVSPLLCYLSSFVNGIMQTKYMNEYKKAIENVEYLLNKHKLSIDSKLPDYQFRIIFVSHIIYLTFECFRLYHLATTVGDIKYLLFLFKVIISIGNSFVTSAYVGYLEGLGMKFKMLTTQVSGAAREEGGGERVTCLARAYEGLCSCSESLERAFRLPVLALLVSNYLSFLVSAFHLARAVLDLLATATPLGALSVASSFAGTLYYFLLSFFLAAPPSRISSQAKEFNEVLYDTMANDISKELLNNDMLDLHIANRQQISFSAYEYFTLDYSLLVSILSSATTYLVLLLEL